MKANLHPTYYPDAKMVCACGFTTTVGSSLPEIRVELCSVCHPFYTGKQNMIDSAGRLDRFKRLSDAKSADASGKKVKAVKRAAQKAEKKAAKGVQVEA